MDHRPRLAPSRLSMVRRAGFPLVSVKSQEQIQASDTVDLRWEVWEGFEDCWRAIISCYIYLKIRVRTRRRVIYFRQQARGGVKFLEQQLGEPEASPSKCNVTHNRDEHSEKDVMGESRCAFWDRVTVRLRAKGKCVQVVQAGTTETSR